MSTADRILAHIKANGPASRNDLMEALCIAKSCATKNLHHLREVKQLIHKCGWQKIGRGTIPLYDLGHKPEPDAPRGVAAMHRMSSAMPECSGEPRRCTSCGEHFPETLEFFGPREHLRNGLDTHCRDCRRKKNLAGYHKRNPVVERIDKYQPMVPILRQDMGDGRTLVRFGISWKPSPAQRIGSRSGYASALSRDMEAPG